MPADQPRLTWVGHSTIVIERDGARILTDPVLTQRLGHLRRRHPRPAPIGPVDIVLISHAHGDHLHPRSLREVARTSPDATIVVPRDAARYVTETGFGRAIEVVAGDVLDLGGVQLTVTEAVHPVGRGPHRRDRAQPVGFVIGTRRPTYFAGDTDLFDGMTALGPIDTALLPIWGWGRTIGSGHLDPPRAADAVELLDSRLVVPIHWGTFTPENARRAPGWLAAPAVDFERALGEHGLGRRLRQLTPGGTLDLR